MIQLQRSNLSSRPSRRRWRGILAYAVLGAVAFWGPNLLERMMRGSDFTGADLLFFTVVPPASVALMLWSSIRYCRGELRARGRAWAMVTGIWLAGPTFIMTNATLAGAGFRMRPYESLGQQLYWHAIYTVVPFYIFIMATYDGTLLALLVTTCVLPALAGWFDRLELGKRLTTA